MHLRKLLIILSVVLFLAEPSVSQKIIGEVKSPDNKIVVSVWLNDAGSPNYRISYQGEKVLQDSRLGLIREDDDFSSSLELVNASPSQRVHDQYELFTGKKSMIQ